MAERPICGEPATAANGGGRAAPGLRGSGAPGLRYDRRMRQLIVSEFLTLDGVVETPGGERMDAMPKPVTRLARS